MYATLEQSVLVVTLHVDAMSWCQCHEGQRDDMTISSLYSLGEGWYDHITLQLPWKQEQMGYIHNHTCTCTCMQLALDLHDSINACTL